MNKYLWVELSQTLVNVVNIRGKIGIIYYLCNALSLVSFLQSFFSKLNKYSLQTAIDNVPIKMAIQILVLVFNFEPLF